MTDFRNLWPRLLAAIAANTDSFERLFDASARLGVLIQPQLTDALTQAILKDWFTGAKSAATGADLVAIPTDTSQWPVRTRAADWLARRQVLDHGSVAMITDAARREGLYLSKWATSTATAQFSDALPQFIVDGSTLGDFRKPVANAAETTTLGRHGVEQIFRTQTARAYAAGQAHSLNHPLVASNFPYRMWIAVHDNRTEDSHRLMERLGLNGTAVYRANDPLWITHTPPVRYNCRCHVIPLTIRQAADEGVHEAQEWLQTGEPPRDVWYAKTPYPPEIPKDWSPTPSVGGPFAVAS